jgi:hypothetical protein
LKRENFKKRAGLIHGRNKQRVEVASTVLMYGGALLAFSALLFMIINLKHADSIIKIWLPFMLGAVWLVFMSQLIKWIGQKPTRQNRLA